MIRIETDGFVRKIGIDRPEKKNSLTASMYADLATAFELANNDDTIRVVVFHGSDECFTAGNDLNDFIRDPPTGPTSPVYKFLHALSTFDKPIVAAVGGYAIGIGTTALLHCDLTLASTDATFRMPFTDLGLCPEAGSSFLLPATVGFKKASELLLLGNPFSADEALKMGFVNQVVVGSVIDAAVSVGQKLAAKPPSAVQLTKRMLKESSRDLVASTIQAEALEFIRLLGSPEAKEAFEAFAQKRPPDFTRL